MDASKKDTVDEMDWEPTLEKQLHGHSKGITSICISPNEQQLASSSLDNNILLWDLTSPTQLRSCLFQGHNDAVMDVTFCSSGRYMASASKDKTIRIWIPSVSDRVDTDCRILKAHSQTIRSVQFSPSGDKIITASDDKIVKLWSANKLKFISSFVGHTNWVRCARMSADGSVIASCSDDKTTKLWNPKTGECIHTYKHLKDIVQYLAWHPCSCYIAVGTLNGHIKIYDIRTHCCVQCYSMLQNPVTQVSFHPSGNYLLSSSKNGSMKILNLVNGYPLFTLNEHSGPTNAVCFSPGGDFFATGGDNKVVGIWHTNFIERESEEDSQMQRVKQGMKMWYQCYHSTKYPVVSFVQVDDDDNHESQNTTNFEEPIANSTMLSPGWHRHKNPHVMIFPSTSSLHSTGIQSVRIDSEPAMDEDFWHVGHISHIPRKPPTPTTYTIPSINKSTVTEHNDSGDLFGMIKLKDNDVCYTSGSIEWVGRKRSYPINSGFKVINESVRLGNEPILKRVKRLDNTYTLQVNKKKDCVCADVLPTVNAIVDHLNALHEAVDIVDLRINTLEDVIGNN